MSVTQEGYRENAGEGGFFLFYVQFFVLLFFFEGGIPQLCEKSVAVTVGSKRGRAPIGMLLNCRLVKENNLFILITFLRICMTADERRGRGVVR